MGEEKWATSCATWPHSWPHCPFLLRRLPLAVIIAKKGFSIVENGVRKAGICVPQINDIVQAAVQHVRLRCVRLMVRRHFLLILLISGTNPPIPVCHRYFPTCVHVRAVANGRKTCVFRGRGSQGPTKGGPAHPFPAPSLQRVGCSAHL